jgi:hypothetical protein
VSDFNSSLPIRTENDGDVVVKVGDSTTPSQQLAVNADGSVNITDNAGSITVDAINLDIRDLVFASDAVDVSGSEVSLDAATLAALESITVQNAAGASAVNIQDGGNSITVDAVDLDIRDLAFATDKVDVGGSVVALDAPTLAALESITVQNGAAGAAVNIQDGGNSITVDAVDLDVRDLTHVSDSIKVGDGTDFLSVNTDGSINVVIQEDVGVETVDYNTAAAIAAGATSNHDLVFASASKLYQIHASASSKLKIEVQVETGAATGVFNTRLVAFNSTAAPNIELTLSKYAAIPLGARVRVIRTNRDNQAQDVYSTIVAILG